MALTMAGGLLGDLPTDMRKYDSRAFAIIQEKWPSSAATITNEQRFLMMLKERFEGRVSPAGDCGSGG
jgi:hypothetical protein